MPRQIDPLTREQHALALLELAERAGAADAANDREYSPTRFRIPQMQDAYRTAFESAASDRAAA